VRANETAPAPTDAAQSLTAAKPLDIAHLTPGPPTDLVAMPSPSWEAFLIGYQDGYVEGESVGYARGWRACDDEMATLQRTAARVVHAAAKLDSHEVAQRRRRERQVEAADRRGQAAQPWPVEATA